MEIKVQNTQQINTHAGVKLIVFGPAGAGKTRLCATMPQPLIISAEKGLLSLRKEKVPYIEVNTLADLQETEKWVLGSREARNFMSFCLDSISEIAENILLHEKGQTKDGRKAYGATQDEIMRILRVYRNLQGPHVYFSAKQEYIKLDDNSMIYAPMMPGNKLAQNLPFFVDEMLHLNIYYDAAHQPFRALRCGPNRPDDIVKDRSGSLDMFEQPDLGNVINKIMKG